jgi:hypothetical protein
MGDPVSGESFSFLRSETMIRAYATVCSILVLYSGIVLANPSDQKLLQVAVAAAEQAEGSQVTKVGRVKCHYETATFCVRVCLKNGNSCSVDMANYLTPNGIETDPEVFACHPATHCQ